MLLQENHSSRLSEGVIVFLLLLLFHFPIYSIITFYKMETMGDHTCIQQHYLAWEMYTLRLLLVPLCDGIDRMMSRDPRSHVYPHVW